MSSSQHPHWGLRDVRSGRILPLALPEIVLGRDSTATVQITHSSVSRRHCRIHVEEGRLRIHDLGSQNGTRVNGSRIAEAELSPGDVVQVGPAKLEVVEYEPAGLANDVREASLGMSCAEATADHGPEDPPDEIVFASLDDAADLPIDVWDDVRVILVDQDKGSASSLRPEVETCSEAGFAATQSTVSAESTAAMNLASTAAAPATEVDRATTPGAWLHIPRPAFEPGAISGWKLKLVGGLLIAAACLFLWHGRSDRRIEGEAVSALEWAAKTESELAGSRAESGAWTAFARQVTNRLTPIVEALEKRASSRRRLAQELLFAARHCRKAFAQGEPADEFSLESRNRFHVHLQNIRSMATVHTSESGKGVGRSAK